MQFKAGYIVDSIAKVVTDFKATLDKHKPTDQTHLNQINGLLQYVSSFDVEFPPKHKYNPDFKKLNPVLASLNNIITRGIPTRAPLILEELFTKINLSEPNIDEFELNFPIAKKTISYENIFELLHIIEPGLEINRDNYGGNLGSSLEWQFIKKHSFLKQVLESQRDFSTINCKLTGGKTVDFCFTSPYLHWNEKNSRYEKVGRIFEVDGPHHSLSEYKYYDAYRDAVAEDENFETIRFTVETIKEDKTDFEKLIGRKIYKNFKKNFENNIKEQLEKYSLIFIPLAVARVQKTILEFLLVHCEFFKKEKIEIAIVERDLPCGAIAIKSLQELFFNINAILEDKEKLLLPEISVTIFENQKWVISKELHLQASVKDESFFKLNKFDIIIDHSILRRSNIYRETDFQNEKSIKIRSSHYFDTSFGKTRRVYCADLLNYKKLVDKKDDGSYFPIENIKEPINYFIQSIFRKKEFREGQLPIISRALQQKPVIGLLPTGGGKSLAFQLPAFLQPGLCLVVDPIKSLMEDQVRVLKQNWIDCCDFINSNLKREEKAKKLIDFRYGETMFLFISPERFVMQDFRNIIYKIDISKFGLAFSYCVIDEVHCVSEWGHDFRSTYLMLGKNSQRFAKTKSEKAVSLLGLTATASFDVLADIERELQIQHDDLADAIIMIENTIRPELFFRVIDVTNKRDRIQELNNDFSNFAINLTKINSERILRMSQKHHFDEFDKKDFATLQSRNSSDENKIVFEYNDKYLIKDDFSHKTQDDFYSIIFCPVKGQKRNVNGEIINEKGVDFVYQNLYSNSKGFFYSSESEEESKEVQEHFENFTSDKTQHIVCTKAFGMGIDKKDIRSTYHYVYSGSLESLVQEAGRSGRDKKISEANILVSKQIIYKLSKTCLLRNSPTSNTFDKISNIFHRRIIRVITNIEFTSKEDLTSEIDKCIDSLMEWNAGNLVFLSEDKKKSFKERLSAFIEEKYEDREIHNYFHKGSFKGTDVEFSQFYSLFNDREFQVSSKLVELNEKYNELTESSLIFKYWSVGKKKRLYVSNFEDELGFIDLALPLTEPDNEIFQNILIYLKSENDENDDVFNLLCDEEIVELNEGTLKETFEKSQYNETFNFIITASKEYPDNYFTIYSKLSELPKQKSIQNKFIGNIKSSFDNVGKFEDLTLKTKGDYATIVFNWFSLHIKHDQKIIEELRKLYKDNKPIEFLQHIYLTQIQKSYSSSKGDFSDFLLLLEEKIDKLEFPLNNCSIERWLKLFYCRNRYFKPSNNTGRLIYRMHSMGFLEDYLIDYNKNNLYYCKFKKYDSIDKYISIIEKYLRRYLSENTAVKTIEDLKARVTKPTLIDNIIECLYFLSDFSYKEIASKRERATDEIESILNTSITEDKYVNDWYLQNLFLKEQIYFYFNAKYARRKFKINGQPFSLLDDYKELLLTKPKILEKYMDVLTEEGTEQNNYKHMIGSCKKIMRSLSEKDLNNEWLLRLLKAFAMYSVNNASYISEANAELELGFDNLYNDKGYHNGKLAVIKPIFDSYFIRLLNNIQLGNSSFNDIKMIRLKLLIKMQTGGINDLLDNIKLN